MSMKPSITVENVSGRFPKYRRTGDERFAVLLHNVFSAKECADLIEMTEKIGYSKALLNMGHGNQQLVTDVRNSERCIVDDPSLAEMIFQRVQSGLKESDPDLARHMVKAGWVPQFEIVHGSHYHAVGCNERLRFLKYEPGQYFKPHFDGSYIRSNGGPRDGEMSLVTAQLYLNEGFKGGSTRFLDRKSNTYLDVVPRVGSVLLFEHNLLHEGVELIEGTKYAVRTDVMYTDKGPGHEYSLNSVGLKSPNCDAVQILDLRRMKTP